MRILKRCMIFQFLFVSVVGTLSHCVYDWSSQNRWLGLFAPISESTFEHMKMFFFPAMLGFLIVTYILIIKHNNYQDFADYFHRKSIREPKDILLRYRNAMSIGILSGTAFIPAFFYTYSGILGFHLAPIDIASFFAAAAIAAAVPYFILKYRRLVSSLWFSLLFLAAASFLIFTYAHPDTGIFTVG